MDASSQNTEQDAGTPKASRPPLSVITPDPPARTLKRCPSRTLSFVMRASASFDELSLYAPESPRSRCASPGVSLWSFDGSTRDLETPPPLLKHRAPPKLTKKARRARMKASLDSCESLFGLISPPEDPPKLPRTSSRSFFEEELVTGAVGLTL